MSIFSDQNADRGTWGDANEQAALDKRDGLGTRVYPQAPAETMQTTGARLTADERAALLYTAGYLEEHATKHEDAISMFWGMFTRAQQADSDQQVAQLRTTARKLRELLAE